MNLLMISSRNSINNFMLLKSFTFHNKLNLSHKISSQSFTQILILKDYCRFINRNFAQLQVAKSLPRVSYGRNKQAIDAQIANIP